MSKKLKKYVPIVAAAFMLNLAGVVDVHALERVDIKDSTKNYGLDYYSSEAKRIQDRVNMTTGLATKGDDPKFSATSEWLAGQKSYRLKTEMIGSFSDGMSDKEKADYQYYIGELLKRVAKIKDEYDPINTAIQNQTCTTDGAVRAEIYKAKNYKNDFLYIVCERVSSVNEMKDISALIIQTLEHIETEQENLKKALLEEEQKKQEEQDKQPDITEDGKFCGEEFAVEAIVLKMNMNGTEFSGTYDPRTTLTISIANQNDPKKYKEITNVKKTEDGQWSFTLDEAKPGWWIKIATNQQGKSNNHESYCLIEKNNKNFPGVAEIKEVDANYSIKGTGPKGYDVKITRFKTDKDDKVKISADGTWSYKFDEELIAGERIQVTTVYDKDNENKLRYKITEDDLKKKDENKEEDKEEGNNGENQGTDKEEGGNSGENQDTNKDQEGNNVENQDSDKKDEENKEQNQVNNNNQSNNSGSGGSHSSSSGSHGGSSGSHSSSSSSKNETNSDENDLDENVKKEVNVISENEVTDNKLETGWQFDGINDWSYIKEDKTKAVNCWLKIDGNWYNFDINGVMRKNYWLKDQEKWYYLSSSGAMATGWLKYNDKWYYLGGNGAMCTGWIQDNNNWYYLGQDGAMKTGWINVDNMWYYLDESGKMAVNTTINGYKINRHGIWVK